MDKILKTFTRSKSFAILSLENIADEGVHWSQYS